MSEMYLFYGLLPSSIVLNLIILFLAIWLLIVMFKRRKLYVLSWKLPGPVALPLFGNVFNLGLFNNHRGYLNLLENLNRRYGEILRIWLGPELCVIVTEPSDIEDVLLSRQAANKGPRYDVLSTVIGPGILTSSGALWKKNRHILNPSFNGANVKSYQAVNDRHSVHLVENLAKFCDTGLVDVSIHCLRWTADIICEALFDHESNFYKGQKDEIVMKTPIIGVLVHERICKFWLESDLVYDLTAVGKEMKNHLRVYRDYYYDVLRDKIRKTLTGVQKGGGDKTLKNPLDVMICAMQEGKLTEQELLNEFNSFFNAGSDTCYTHLSFFILMMGINKRCQDRVWQEIKDVFSNDLDAPVTSDMISRMSYLELCLKEVTRLFPTGPIQMRSVDQDFLLRKRNLLIPAGTSLMISNFMLHRNSKFWDKPGDYIPERFLPENSKTRPHFAYIPFSAGLRNCIAQVFGYDMLKTAAIHMLRNIEFHSDMRMDEVSVKADISTRCAKGYHVRITTRDREL